MTLHPRFLFSFARVVVCAAAVVALGSTQTGAAHASMISRLSLPLGGPPPRGHETVLYTFQEGKDGGYPTAGVTPDGVSGFFGTTGQGGGSDDGAVYHLTPSGSGYAEEVLYRFRGGADGALPEAGVIVGTGGTLLGTTEAGGGTGCNFNAGCGTVYELVPKGSTYKEHVVHAFGSAGDGALPFNSLLLTNSGIIYGTANEGGSQSCVNGCGVVFALTPKGSTYTESIVYAFQGGADGAVPDGQLIGGPDGTLYGTTATGGTGSVCECGTVFALSPSGSGFTHSVLYSFQGGPDGGSPRGGLVRTKQGELIGFAQGGGNPACGGGSGCGVAYHLVPVGSTYMESVLYAFNGGADGWLPVGTPSIGNGGAVYGATQTGGAGYDGTVFRIVPSGSTYAKTTLVTFNGHNGATPLSSPINVANLLVGTTFLGGHMDNRCPSGGCGVVYSAKP